MRMTGRRAWLACAIVVFATAGAAQAQTPPPAADEGHGYVEAVADAAFGSASSQSYGVEGGYTFSAGLQVFVEAGRVNNVASGAFFTAAQTIAGGLAQTQSDVGFSAKEPAAFGDVGVRYLAPVYGMHLQPYVQAGIGVARVTNDARFTINGTDVTGNLTQYGVQLGTDLSGHFTRPLLALGAGVTLPVWSRVVVDLQYRYGRIFAADQGINVNRAGIGLGVSF
jgi:opacity protein-like surface antigen